MNFADPRRCPDCRAELDGGTWCPSCRLDLTSEAAREVWQALQSADAWLDVARRHRVPVAPSVVPPPPPPPPPVTSVPSAPAMAPVGPPPTPRPRRRISVGTVLLALGAFALIVAGSIFITVYWGPMGIIGRALVLLAVTAVFGALAVLVTRRHLRASAEALWAVFLSLFSLDWLAARDQGLLRLDAVPAAPVELAWAVVVGGLATLIVSHGRRHLQDHDEPIGLITPSVAAGLAAVIAVVRRGGELLDAELDVFWMLAMLTAGLGVFAVALCRLRLTTGALVAAGVGATLAAAAVVAAVAQAGANPSGHSLLLEGDGLPLLLVSALLLAAATMLRERALLASALTVPAVLGIVLLVMLPSTDAYGGEGSVVSAAGLLVLGSLVRGEAVGRGVRWAACVPAVLVATVLAFGALGLVGAVTRSVIGWGSHQLTDRLLDIGDLPMAAWVPLVAGSALGISGLLLRPRAPATVVRHLPLVAVLVLLTGGWSSIALHRPTALLLALALLGGALLLGYLPLPSPGPRAVIAGVVVAGAPLAALDSWAACLITWPIAALLLAVLAVTRARGVWRELAACAASWWSAGAVASAFLLTEQPATVIGPAVVACAAVLAAVAAFLRRRGGRVGVEFAAAAVAAIGLAQSAAMLGPVEFSVVVVVLAAAVTLLQLVQPDRGWYAAVGVPLALLAAGTGWTDWGTAAWVWPLAAGLLLVSVVRAPALARPLLVGGGTVLAIGSVLPPTHLLQVDDVVRLWAVLGTSLLAVVLAALAVPRRWGGVGAEVAGGLLAAGVLLAAQAWVEAGTQAAAGLVTAAVLVAVGWLSGRRSWYVLVAVAPALLAVVVSVESWQLAWWTWPVAGLLTALAAGRCGDRERPVVVGLAGLLLGGTVWPAAQVLELSTSATTLGLVVAGAIVLVAALLVLRPSWGGQGAEVSGGLLVLGGVLVASATTGPAHVALLLTVAGAVTAGLSLLVEHRAWYRMVGIAALAVAFVLRLVASEVGVVEAYTLPFGLALLGVGLWATLRPGEGRAAPRTVVGMGPGLLLTLAPSLPQALDDPTSLRGLLLGLGALLVMVTGILRRWQAPFVGGAAVVAVLLVANLGPYAWALPRWVLIAVAGAVMLGAGVTWEQRVRDGRAAVRWVGAMQ